MARGPGGGRDGAANSGWSAIVETSGGSRDGAGTERRPRRRSGLGWLSQHGTGVGRSRDGAGTERRPSLRDGAVRATAAADPGAWAPAIARDPISGPGPPNGPRDADMSVVASPATASCVVAARQQRRILAADSRRWRSPRDSSGGSWRGHPRWRATQFADPRSPTAAPRCRDVSIAASPATWSCVVVWGESLHARATR